MEVEVVYALQEGADAVRLRVGPGVTAADAVRMSGILERHPEIDPNKVGVYGRVVAPETPLADGDRVEVYRPLVMDPKEARRRRAVKKKR
ncbi:MAG: RnfH family protein [Betaproteobacteria bacterium]|nr:MAG: RnfH family protein [Betaproteobacteria bacterium]